MNIFSFSGWSGTGKTTLISKLTRELSNRGWKVMAVKKVPDKYHLEPEGKDSRRFLEHGAETVYLVAKKEIMRMELTDGTKDLLEFARQDLQEHDFILLEGLATGKAYNFEVFDPDISDKLKSDKKNLSAIISEHRVFNDIKFFNRNDISGLADHLELIKRS